MGNAGGGSFQAMEEELAVPKSQAIDIRQLGTVIREARCQVVSTILNLLFLTGIGCSY